MSVSESDLVPVTRLPEKFHKVYQYRTFNTIQSRCFDLVMSRDDNMILSAPTGSGKTVIAELAFIHAVTKENRPTLMLYVSPLRSLCQEKVRDWCSKFESCGIIVDEYTGDSSNIFPTSVKTNTILCTTPEKLDLATRSWNTRVDVFAQISVMVVDEVHMLGDSRGAVLEAMVSRLLYISDRNRESKRANPIRIIALSATVPNYQDIAEWLRVDPSVAAQTKFGEEFRPVSLETHVVGFTPAKNDWMFESSLNMRIGSVVSKYWDEKPVIVFCCTRKSCEKTATRLASDFPKLANHQLDVSSVKDKQLAQCLKTGVGFHTAGLCPSDRTVVEQLFIRGSIKIICTTSTLAQGVNLPAHLVVIKGTKHYTDNSLQDYDTNQMLQMAGRAGRPQFHDNGVCVIMTEKHNQEKYRQLMDNKTPIESCLMDNLAEHLNAEIALGFIRVKLDVTKWLKSTYLYIRVRENPLYYHIDSMSSIQISLTKQCMRHVHALVEAGLVKIEEDGSLTPLPAGSVCSKYGVMINTMVLILQSEPPTTLKAMLELLSKASEFKDCAMRQEEKHKLRLMSVDPELRFGSRSSDDDNFYSPETKVFLLIESALAHGKIEDWNLSQEFSRIKKTSDRLLACITQIMIEKASFYGATNALVLQKCINQHMWDNEKSRLAQQIKGIGEVFARKIHAGGHTSFDDLRSLRPYQIERLTNHRPGWAVPIVDEIARVPHYMISTIRTDGSDELAITIRNISEQDPSSQFHHAIVLVGVEDHLLAHFKIKQVIGHLSVTYNIEIPNGVDPEEITVRCIDEFFIGIDVDYTHRDILPRTSDPVPEQLPAHHTQLINPSVNDSTKVRVQAKPPVFLLDSDTDEEVVWEMKKPSEVTQEFHLDQDFWSHLEFDDDSQ